MVAQGPRLIHPLSQKMLQLTHNLRRKKRKNEKDRAEIFVRGVSFRWLCREKIRVLSHSLHVHFFRLLDDGSLLRCSCWSKVAVGGT